MRVVVPARGATAGDAEAGNSVVVEGWFVLEERMELASEHCFTFAKKGYTIR